MPVERISRGFKDLSMTFKSNPLNGDLIGLKDANAIARSVTNIVMTYPGEKFFQPDFGSNIRALLFEQMNPITVERIKSEVLEAVARHEPRAQVIGVSVEAQEEQNRYLVSVVFNVASESEPQRLETVFTRP